MSAGGAKESFAATRLIALRLKTTASRPWLRSSAATRLNKDAAAPRYLCKFTKTNLDRSGFDPGTLKLTLTYGPADCGDRVLPCSYGPTLSAGNHPGDM